MVFVAACYHYSACDPTDRPRNQSAQGVGQSVSSQPVNLEINSLISYQSLKNRYGIIPMAFEQWGSYRNHSGVKSICGVILQTQWGQIEQWGHIVHIGGSN